MSDEITQKIRISDLVRHQPLTDLRARFVSLGLSTGPDRRGLRPLERFGVALEMDCPNPEHRAAHRVTVFFLNPCDGMPPIPNQTRYYWRTENTIERLTLNRSDHHDHVVELDGHWRGYIIEGEAVDLVTFGGAP